MQRREVEELADKDRRALLCCGELQDAGVRLYFDCKPGRWWCQVEQIRVMNVPMWRRAEI